MNYHENASQGIREIAEGFVLLCNESLGIGKSGSLNQHHLQQLSEQSNITPIAYLNTGNHWTLVVGKTDKGIEIYDPQTGLREVALLEIKKIWYFPREGPRQKIPEYFFAHSYELPREKLEELGILQEGKINCGQLCVFAAKYSKGI